MGRVYLSSPALLRLVNVTDEMISETELLIPQMS
jgi:hypothetical protein